MRDVEMITRCKYSKHGLEQLRRSQRSGRLVRVQRSGSCLVHWDGLKCATAYHPSFIEVLPPEGDDGPDLLEERIRPADALRISRAQ